MKHLITFDKAKFVKVQHLLHDNIDPDHYTYLKKGSIEVAIEATVDVYNVLTGAGVECAVYGPSPIERVRDVLDAAAYITGGNIPEPEKEDRDFTVREVDEETFNGYLQKTPRFYTLDRYGVSLKKAIADGESPEVILRRDDGWGIACAADNLLETYNLWPDDWTELIVKDKY